MPTYDLIVTMAVFPLLLLASASGNPPRGWSKLFQILGTASYAIYVLHMPMEQFFEFTWSRFAHHAPYLDAPWPGMLFVSLVIVFALVADSAFDLPLRAYLRNRLLEPSRANEIQTGRSKHGVSM